MGYRYVFLYPTLAGIQETLQLAPLGWHPILDAPLQVDIFNGTMSVRGDGGAGAKDVSFRNPWGGMDAGADGRRG